MRLLKRFLLSLLLNKEEKDVILKSLRYSEYRYKRHGYVDLAVSVTAVRKKFEALSLKSEKKEYTESEVDSIVKYVLSDYTKWLRKKENKPTDVCLTVGTVIDKDKCDKCDNRDDCEINKTLFHDDDDKGKSADGEDTANAQKNDATDDITSVKEE